MILDDDETVIQQAEVDRLRCLLRLSHLNMMNYVKIKVGQAEVKHK